MQRFMNFAHESMEMHTAFSRVGYRGKKTIHQKTFAPPDSAPEPDAPWQVRTHQQFAQRRTPRRLESDQIVIEFLQALCRGQLRRIGDDAALDEHGIEAVDH